MTTNLLTTANAAAVPMMTADEARTTIATINDRLDDARRLVLDLQEREGWRALGYASWRACAMAEFGHSQSRVYQLLVAAKVDQALSTIVESPIPESHARVLAPLLRATEPAEVARVYETARATAPDGKVTAAHVQRTVIEAQALEQREVQAEALPPSLPAELPVAIVRLGKFQTDLEHASKRARRLVAFVSEIDASSMVNAWNAEHVAYPDYMTAAESVAELMPLARELWADANNLLEWWRAVEQEADRNGVQRPSED